MIHFQGHETAALLVLCLFLSPVAVLLAGAVVMSLAGWLDGWTGWMTRR